LHTEYVLLKGFAKEVFAICIFFGVVIINVTNGIPIIQTIISIRERRGWGGWRKR
jgi:hypothetical protein